MERFTRTAGAAILGGAGLLALALVSPRAVPFNMDEFVHYHALGCVTAPLGRDLPPARDGCGLYDLRLPGASTPLPLRSYYYIGSFPALPFLPFWLLLDDPVAARVQGAAFLALLLALAARVLRVRGTAVVTAALVYPVFAASVVVDEGPVGLSALLLLAALACARRAVAGRGALASVCWAAAAGFALFLGIWVKLVFAWWLPAIACFLAFEARRRRGAAAVAPAVAPAPHTARAAAAGLLAFVIPTLVLLASVDVDGRPYGAALRRGRVTLGTEQVEAGGGRLLPYLLDGSLLLPRNLSLPGSAVDVVPALLAAGLLAFGLRRGAARRAEVASWTLVAATTFGLVSLSAYSQWPHHFFFPLLPLVFALALVLDAAGPRARRVALVVALAFWATLAARWPAAAFPTDASPDKDQLLRFVRERGLDRETLQAHTSWGTYYVAQLFGDPARLLVYAKGLSDDPRLLRQLATLSRERGRPLLLSSSRRWERLQTPAVDAILGHPQRTWRFGDWWLVEYEPPAAGGTGATSSSRRP